MNELKILLNNNNNNNYFNLLVRQFMSQGCNLLKIRMIFFDPPSQQNHCPPVPYSV